MSLPSPTLTYYFWGRQHLDTDVIPVEVPSPRLFSIHEVSVSMEPADDEGNRVMYAYLSGPLRKRDGSRGMHRRSVRVLPRPDQPQWLVDLFNDARPRL